jgi:hypothetical protein
MNYIRTYDTLYAQSLTPEFHERTCGYWFTVTSYGATAHTAFATRAGLDRWLNERGLALERDLPDYSDGTVPGRDKWHEGMTRITGTYRTEYHGEHVSDDPCDGMTEGDWPPAHPVAATAEMSNGRYTLAGIRTVHTLNPNVRTRIEFDRINTRRWLES